MAEQNRKRIKIESYEQLLEVGRNFTFPCFLELPGRIADVGVKQMELAERVRSAKDHKESRAILEGANALEEDELSKLVRNAKTPQESRELILANARKGKTKEELHTAETEVEGDE